MSILLRAAVVLSVAWSIASVQSASCTEIQASTANKAAVLGSAYDQRKELFVGQACLQGTPQSTGVSSSEFHLDVGLSQKEMSSKLGLDVDGKARYGAVSASASAHFLRDASATAFSVSSIWSSEYFLPPSVLTNPTKSPIGTAAATDPVHWAETCGDEFVDEERLGARLMVSVRVDFASQQQKEDFESRFSLSGPLASVDATLKQATTEFARDTRITIAGTQFGGDVTKLTGIFDNSVDGKEAFTKCSLGDFENCATVIVNMLDYATNTNTGFPSQLAQGALPGGAVLSYHTSSYSSAAIFNDRQALVAVVLEARDRLFKEFEKQFALLVLGNRLNEWGGLGAGQQMALDKALQIVQSNLDQILKASEVCYGDKPSDCPATVNGLSLKAVDPDAFKLPPSPEGSFRVWTSENSLLGRDESVALMTACHQEPNGNCQRPQQLGEVAGQGTASIVLYLKGTSLKEAHLFFEDEALGEAIPLRATAAPSEKVGSGWAMLVVESTRQTANWRDIDLAARRAKLMQKPGFGSADGTFYVLVDDTFGRRTRFDIEYERWNASVLVRRANRWWDRAGGVVTAGTGNWTYEQLGESGMWNRGTGRRSISIQACGGGGGGGGAGGARNEQTDNGGGGGAGAGSPLVSVALWDLMATAYPIRLGAGGAGGQGGPGGGNSGNGGPGVAGTATVFGPSTETMAGAAVDDRTRRWEGAPSGSGGVAPLGFPMTNLYVPDRDGKGGPGGSGGGFTAGGSGGGPDAGGGAGAPSSTAPGGSGGSSQPGSGRVGGGGGGGGAGAGPGGPGGNGGGLAASPGGTGGLCAGGGGGGAYGEQNLNGTAGGAGGGGTMEIFALQPCPEYDLAKLRPEGCSSLTCESELRVASYARYLGSDRVFKIGSELLYCRSIGNGDSQNPVRRDCMVIGKKTAGGRTICSVERYFDCHGAPSGPEVAYCDMQAHP